MGHKLNKPPEFLGITTANIKISKSELILEALIDLIDGSKEGLPSLEQIAKQAGVAKGTLFLYFSSREELLYRGLEAGFVEFYQELETTISQRYGYKQLKAEEFSVLFIESLQNNPIISNLLPHLPLLTAKLNFYPKLYTEFSDWFKRMISRVHGITPSSYQEKSQQIFLAICTSLFVKDLQIIRQTANSNWLQLELIKILCNDNPNESKENLNSSFNFYANY